MEPFSLGIVSALFIPTLVALALPVTLAFVARRDAAKRQRLVPIFARIETHGAGTAARRTVLRG